VESARHGQHSRRVRWLVEGRCDSRRNSSQQAEKEHVGSTARECSSPDKEGDPSAAGMIPSWKIVEQQLGAMMGGKQTREVVTRNSEQ
jgi:hypothetical protein